METCSASPRSKFFELEGLEIAPCTVGAKNFGPFATVTFSKFLSKTASAAPAAAGSSAPSGMWVAPTAKRTRLAPSPMLATPITSAAPVGFPHTPAVAIVASPVVPRGAAGPNPIFALLCALLVRRIAALRSLAAPAARLPLPSSFSDFPSSPLSVPASVCVIVAIVGLTPCVRTAAEVQQASS
jgi:hypothetical protein